MAITVAQLRTFLAVERAGSVKGAAEALVVTQPSVSGAIAALERELGVKLFERRGRGVGLTEAGEAFVPYAARVLALLEEGRSAAQEAADPRRRELKIAAVNTAGEYIVPPLVRAFRGLEPDLEVRLEVGNRSGMLRRLQLGDADIGIGGSPPESGEIDGVPFLENEHVVIAPPDHHLAGRKALLVRELEGEIWILREPGSGTRSFVERLLADWGISPRTMSMGSNGAIKQAVSSGLGISLQSRHATVLELRMGLLTDLDIAAGIPTRRWHALIRSGEHHRPVVRDFLSFLRRPEARRAVEGAAIAPLSRAPAPGRSP